jgi:FAD/FMN-containing dehydrogenase/Fe-S oxidoreductase
VTAVNNTDALQRDLESQVNGEVRFDRIARALYATDASVYQIVPLGVVVPRTRGALVKAVQLCIAAGVPVTMRGGGTSQAGQAVGAGVIIDTSKYLHHLLEVNVAERWARVEPGIVLDELNAHLHTHGLRFAPDISTADRATLGGMMANNSSGARSLYYGKTIDHVLEQDVLLADGSLARFGPRSDAEAKAAAAASTLEGACYRVVRTLARQHAAEIDRRYPKLLRRVGGYNLDEFVSPDRPFNLARIMVGSEGTLGVVLEAKVNLVPLPRAKAVLVIQFGDLLDSLAATPLILRHHPSAVEVMDRFILDHTRKSPTLNAIRKTIIDGEPGALLCVEMYGDRAEDLPPRLEALERDLRANGFGDRYVHALDLPTQARIWSLRAAALGLSMAMRDDAKSLSFVEDTAVDPARLRDYIARFLALVRRHDTVAGVYAHASVGCLHVRPVVNLKTADGVRKFEAIANESADLVLEFGGSLSGEHGDGLVRSSFMRKMYGDELYEAFRTIKRTFDPHGVFNPGKIVDAPPLTANLRYGAGYQTPEPTTFFDYGDSGGFGRAVEMCSGIGACRKTLSGTMCPSYMATRDEAHSTRGRANVLRLAMTGRLEETGLGDDGVYSVLDLCLECRACKTECPVGVDVARFKSEFLADYWTRHGIPLEARLFGQAHGLARWGSRLAPMSNWLLGSAAGRRVNEWITGIDRRRRLPQFQRRTLADSTTNASGTPDVILFGDTFTNYYEPAIGIAALKVLAAAGVTAEIAAPGCCGRPQISKGLLADARVVVERTTRALATHAEADRPILFCEPSCLSAVREDAPALLRGEARAHAKTVAHKSFLLEEYLATIADRLPLMTGPRDILLHGHCHQTSMGLLAPARQLLEKIPGATVVDLDAGCCGMAGSFGYAQKHYDVSREIGERTLFPAVRARPAGAAVVTAGTSCRYQIRDFTDIEPVHPVILLASLLERSAHT